MKFFFACIAAFIIAVAVTDYVSAPAPVNCDGYGVRCAYPAKVYDNQTPPEYVTRAHRIHQEMLGLRTAHN